MVDELMGGILVVEDSDKKFEHISSIISEACGACEVTRAATMIEAEELLLDNTWSLIVLDISMDIAPSTIGRRARGQANVGGLELAQKMFLLNCEAPTIIVTAFDSFSTGHHGHGTEILDFEEVRNRASEYLPGSLVACLQYSDENWRSDMIAAVRVVLSR